MIVPTMAERMHYAADVMVAYAEALELGKPVPHMTIVLREYGHLMEFGACKIEHLQSAAVAPPTEEEAP